MPNPLSPIRHISLSVNIALSSIELDSNYAKIKLATQFLTKKAVADTIMNHNPINTRGGMPDDQSRFGFLHWERV